MEGDQEQPKPIEVLTEQELRQEIIDGINTTLGTLAVGPVADGTGAMGYGREWGWWKKLYGEGFQKGMMLPLFCSYLRFTKAYEKDEQIGVRLELLGLMDSGRMFVHLKPEFEEKTKNVATMTPQEKEEFQKFSWEMENGLAAIEADGLDPADNRYYFIPLNEVEPAMVSTESFISRAWSLNPQAAERVLLSEVISEELDKQEAPIDPDSGMPRWRMATLQDLRDAVAIIRGYKNFVAEIIQQTPKDVWGRPGMTE